MGTSKEDRTIVYLCAGFATIGGLLFGYDTGIISGSMILIRKDFQLSKIWQEAIVSTTVGAAALASLLAGYLTDALGRKKVILMGSFIFTIGVTVMAASIDKYMLLSGRLLVGIAIGFVAMTVPVYVAEIAPPSIRGRLVSLNQLSVTSGIVISSLLAGAFSSDEDNGWRYMLGLGAVPSVIQFIAFIFLPESPRWLVKNGKIQDAENALVKIRRRSPADIKTELTDIKEMVDTYKSQTDTGGGSTLKRILITPHVRKALFIGCMLQMFQQFCGVNTVIYYSASILQMAGFPDNQAIWWACVPNAMNLLCTCIGLYFVEKTGRKKLLVASTIGVMVACIVLAVGFQLQLEMTPSINQTLQHENYPEEQRNGSCFSYTICDSCISGGCGFCFVEGKEKINGGACVSFDLDAQKAGSDFGFCDNTTTQEVYGVKWAPNYCPTGVAWLSILGLALYVMTFPTGLGPMPWTINSEIYPLWARSVAASLATAINWTCNLIVSFTFLTLSDAITIHGTFYIFSGICLLAIIFAIALVPETKNKTLEQIEVIFLMGSEKEPSDVSTMPMIER